MKKRVMALVEILVLLVSVCLQVQAAQTGRFIQEAAVRKDIFEIHCAPMPEEGSFQVTLGGKKLEMKASTQAQAMEPMTLYCLVDASGSIDANQLELVREILRNLNSTMPDNSNMVLGLLEDQVAESELLQTQEQRSRAIDALAPTDGNTNLYGGIVSALERLNVSSLFHPRRCLLVFSDGEDYSAEGSARTVQEVLDTISGTPVPIYTVSVAYRTQDEASKNFGSFARASVGGLHFTPLQNQQEPQTVSGEIWDSLQSSVILTADASQLQVGTAKDIVLLRVIYTTQDAQYEDTLELFAEDLHQATQSTTEPTQESSTFGSGEEDPVVDDSKVNWILVIAVALAAIVLAIVVAVLAVRKKEKSQEQIPEQIIAQPEETELKQTPEPRKNTPRIPVGASARKLLVQMVLLRRSDVGCTFQLEEGKPSVIGRAGADIVPNPQDASLSASHCSIVWNGTLVSVQDIGSTNGTYINGVPIRGKGWMPLEDGARLRVGSGEYRMVFQNITP